LALIYPVIIESTQSIMKYPSIKRSRGASKDLMPNLQIRNPVPALIRPNANVKGGH